MCISDAEKNFWTRSGRSVRAQSSAPPSAIAVLNVLVGLLHVQVRRCQLERRFLEGGAVAHQEKAVAAVLSDAEADRLELAGGQVLPVVVD